MSVLLWLCYFFFNDTATTEIDTYVHTLSLHDALPISQAERASEQAVGEPLEAHRRLVQPAIEPRCDAIDHAAADHGLADRGPGAPLRAVAEQVVDHRRHVVVRRQQARSEARRVGTECGSTCRSQWSPYH